MLNRNCSVLTALMALSLVATGAQAAQPQRFERQFLGIRLMSRGISVLRKYGSPSRVIAGSGYVIEASEQRLPDKDTLSLTVNSPGGGGNGPIAPTGPGVGPYGPGSGPYAQGSGPYGPGSGPYGPGMPYAPPPAGGDSASTTGQAPSGTQWIYDYPKKGLTNVFTLNEEGSIIAIWQLGAAVSSRTSRSVGLGSTYADVVRVYGFPDSHVKQALQSSQNAGAPLDTLQVSYMETHGVEFIFINQRLRGHPNFKGQGPWCVGVIIGTDDFVL